MTDDQHDSPVQEVVEGELWAQASSHEIGERSCWSYVTRGLARHG